MSGFDPQAYAAPVAALLAAARLCELGPGRPNQAVRAQLAALDDGAMWPGQSILERDLADACRAGLWLAHDFFDESHRISQDIETATGSYWHGILHRREPDYSNAKYWFRRVGQHPVFEPLAHAARELTAGESVDRHTEFLAQPGSWDPFRFVDACEACARGESKLAQLCRRVQQREWELLFDYCYRQAVA